MANAYSHPMASFGTPVGAGGLLRHVLEGIRARRAASAQRSRLRRELSAFSDRELADFGLFRSDIEAVACGRYSR